MRAAEADPGSKLQGNSLKGKRLDIASQFKKDNICLRRVEPNKREFHILVALYDSPSMSDYQSRKIALSSLNTLFTALALLEVGWMDTLP